MNTGSLRPVWFAVLIVALVYVLTLAMLPRGGFWITDNDNKYLQMQALIEQGMGDASIPWPGSDIDPGYNYNPLPAPFSAVHEGRLYSIFSPVFSLVSSLPYRLFGETGLFLLPLVGGILTILGCGVLARTLGMDARGAVVAVLIAGLASPLWFYSVVFWEHIVAVAFAVWSVVFLIRFVMDGNRRDLVLMAVATAFGVYFRDELYLFCALLITIAALTVRSKRSNTILAAAGIMGVVLLPLWLYQWWAIGQPFGFHLGTHLFSVSGITEHVAARPQVIYNLFLAIHPNVVLSTLFTLPVVILLLVPESVRSRYTRILGIVVPVFGLFVGAVVLTGFVAAESPIVWLLRSNGLLSAAPLLVLAIIPRTDPGNGTRFSPRTLLWLVIAGYLALYCLAAPELGSSGIHWGNRFVLLLYPLIIVLGLHAAWPSGNARRNRTRGLTWATIMLVILSFGAQFYSIRLLTVKKGFSKRLTETIADRPEQVIVSTVWWAPQALCRDFYSRRIFYVHSQEQLQMLGRKLNEAGEDRILFITQAGERRTNGGVRVDDGGLGFFSLDLVPLSLRQPAQ